MSFDQSHPLLTALRRFVRPYRAGWRHDQAALCARYDAIIPPQERPRLIDTAAGLERRKTALLMGFDTPKLAALQFPLLASLRFAGYRVLVLLPDNRGATSDFYRSIGADEILSLEEIVRPVSTADLASVKRRIVDGQSLLAAEYGGVGIGKFVASTVMRRSRIGSVDPRNPDLADNIEQALKRSMAAVDWARRIFDRYNPDLVCFYDRGYTPEGELSEVAFSCGARAMTWNSAHKGGYIMSKRQNSANKSLHFSAPSQSTWQHLTNMPWTAGLWDALREEVEGCYRSGTWYDEVGTQFNKHVRSRDDIIRELGLDPSKKTAVVFPHLFWDATFFWGEDLFDDYRDWFCQVLQVAADNPRLNWIVKLHPASVVKDRRDNFHGEASEITAMRETLGARPDHMAFLPPDSPISTLSVYSVMDYCLTVRGTVGIESAIFGVPVLTAGTGRYDGYGFTIDSRTREEYLSRLNALNALPPPSAGSVETARRFAYGLFMLRPLELHTLRFRYLQDESATLDLSLNLPADRELSKMPDIVRLSDWLASDAEDLVGNPNF